MMAECLMLDTQKVIRPPNLVIRISQCAISGSGSVATYAPLTAPADMNSPILFATSVGRYLVVKDEQHESLGDLCEGG